MAIESERITADVVEASEFPELSQRYAVSAVPKTVVNDSLSSTSTPFASKLRLKVEDLTAGTTLYDNVLGSMGTIPASTIQPGAANAHTYKFSVTFPNTPGANGGDNVYQGASVKVDFNWEAVNN